MAKLGPWDEILSISQLTNPSPRSALKHSPFETMVDEWHHNLWQPWTIQWGCLYNVKWDGVLVPSCSSIYGKQSAQHETIKQGCTRDVNWPTNTSDWTEHMLKLAKVGRNMFNTWQLYVRLVNGCRISPPTNISMWHSTWTNGEATTAGSFAGLDG